MALWVRSLLGIATLGGVLSPSCTHYAMGDHLSARFSREHSCQADQILIRQSGATSWYAEGCGRHAEYVCPAVTGPPGSENACVKSGVVPNASPEAPKRTHYELPDPPK